MSTLFLTVINMSISASWIVLAVLLLRLVLKKAPKWLTVMLWGIVAVRLICPITIESVLSLIPSAETISPEIIVDGTPRITSGFSFVNNTVNPIISQPVSPAPEAPASQPQTIIPILTYVWLAGVTALFIYTAVSYIRVRRKVRTAVLLRDNIYQCETVASPFVLGIIKPRIYLGFNISEQNESLVIAHEQAHIKRKDHLWKPLGFLLLSLHWFNPLLWLGYILLCRDIELACDEKVVNKLNGEERADYSEALLTCSVNRRIISACPVAFGEVGVKERVKKVLNYKKPAFWIIIISVIAVTVTAVCFLTNPNSVELLSVESLDRSSYKNDTVTVTRHENSEVEVLSSFDSKALTELSKLRISKNEISKDRSLDRDKTHTVILQNSNDIYLTADTDIQGLRIHFNKSFTEVWLNDGTKATLSYKVQSPKKAKKAYTSLCHNVVVSSDNTTELKVISSGSDDKDVTVDVVSLFRMPNGSIALKIKWNNNSDKTINYGEPFELERFTDNKWGDVSFKRDDIAWNLPAYPVVPLSTESDFSRNQNREFTYVISNYYPIYESGAYRFSTEFTYANDGTKKHTVWVKFELSVIEGETYYASFDSVASRYPLYFGLPTENGLDVYMDPTTYRCTLLPGRETPFKSYLEMWDSSVFIPLEYEAPLNDMRMIVASYLIKDPDCSVNVYLCSSIYSSSSSTVIMPINETFEERSKRLKSKFFENFPTIVEQYPFYDEGMFDIDGDGKKELCIIKENNESDSPSFSFLAYDGETLKYQDVLKTQHSHETMYLFLYEDKVYLLELTDGTEPNEHDAYYYEVSVNDGHISLSLPDAPSEKFAYIHFLSQFGTDQE